MVHITSLADHGWLTVLLPSQISLLPIIAIIVNFVAILTIIFTVINIYAIKNNTDGISEKLTNIEAELEKSNEK